MAIRNSPTRVWFGLLVKAGTPPDIVDRLTDAAKAAHADPEVRRSSKPRAIEVTGETGPQLLPDIKTQTRALGADREGGGIFVRGSRQHDAK